MPDARHHVVFVAVPVPAAGSPAPLNRGKPPAYPRQERAPWKPADKPPRHSQALGLRRLIDGIRHNDEAAREFMAEARRRTA
jgi:hypothetical protein